MPIFLKHPSYGDFKRLSEKRIREAMTLRDKKLYSGAYYLAGCSIELAFKACYCKTVKAKSYPVKEVVFDLYTHSLDNILKHCDVNIKNGFDKELSLNKQREKYWMVVKD